MSGQNYYLLTSLPTLGEPGSPPPLTPGDLLQRVRECGRAAEVEAVMLGDDLLQRQAFLAGEIEEVDPAVLSIAQTKNEAPLPDYLVVPAGDEADATHTADAVWEAYFRHAAAVARRTGSEFLRQWVQHEVSLRNALAVERAKALNLDAEAARVAADLGGNEELFDELIREWAAAPDPLAGQRVLDAARWDWLTGHDSYFRFTDDEVAAYAAKLMLLNRWNRIAAAERAATNDERNAP